MKMTFKLDLKGVNSQKIHDAQVFLDSEIIRRSDKLVPFDRGVLKGSAPIETKYGSGVICYRTPYAKTQYFRGKSNGQRGRLWVRRMWAVNKDDILRGARERLVGE